MIKQIDLETADQTIDFIKGTWFINKFSVAGQKFDRMEDYVDFIQTKTLDSMKTMYKVRLTARQSPIKVVTTLYCAFHRGMSMFFFVAETGTHYYYGNDGVCLTIDRETSFDTNELGPTRREMKRVLFIDILEDFMEFIPSNYKILYKLLSSQ